MTLDHKRYVIAGTPASGLEEYHAASFDTAHNAECCACKLLITGTYRQVRIQDTQDLARDGDWKTIAYLS